MSTMAAKTRLFWVGNFVSAGKGLRTVSEDITERLAQNGWESIKVSYRANRLCRIVDIIFTILRRQQQYDLACVEVYSGLAFLWAEIASLLLTWLHKPLVLILHGGGLIEFSNQNNKRVLQLLKRGTIVVTPSLFLQKGLAPLFSKIRYVPNGLEINAYPFRLRNKPGRTLLWLRAFHQTYQPQLAVHALAELVKISPDVNLIMVGPDKKDGSLEQVLQDARRLNVAEQVSIVGAIPGNEIPGWLDRADIFINTTRFESFGISVMEAAASGLPIVTTNAGELPFLWKDGHNALLVPTGDANSMAAAIDRLLSDGDLAASLSQQARQKAEEFAWNAVLPQWQCIFHEVMNA